MSRLSFVLPLGGFLMLVGSAAAAPVSDDVRALWAAARSGDVKKVEAALARGADVNARDEIGISALWLAAGKGHLEVVKVLLKHGADASTKDNIWYESPLSMAAGGGKKEMVEALLQAGAEGADAALLDAAAIGRPAVVGAILARGKPAAEVLEAALLGTSQSEKEVRELLEKAGAKMPRKATAEERAMWEPLLGTYENENGGKFIIELRQDGLIGKPYFGTSYVLKATVKDRFVAVGRPAVSMAFERTGKEASKLVLRRYTAEISYYRLDPKSLPKPTSSGIELTGGQVSAVLNWPQFRGPNASGIGDGQQAPTHWNVEKGEGVLWKTAIPGLGHSCPIVWGERVFVTTAISGKADQKTVRTGNYGDVTSVNDTSKHAWKVYCVDRKSGKILWERTACEGVPRVKRHLKGSQANCTPSTDGRHVVACFGSEGLYCYDVQGKLLWKRDLGLLDASFLVADEYQWGFGSSPVIFEGLVMLQCDVAHDSFIAAYSLEDGRQVWSTPRDEIASWATPTVWRNPQRVEIVTNASQFARGYDPRTGKELWRLAKKSEATIPTPVLGESLVYLTSGNRPIQPIFAVRPGAMGDISLKEGEDSNQHIAWSRMRGGPYMPTPILYGKYLYVCSNAGMVTCYEADSGKEVYKQRMGGVSYTASPLAADGRLYFTSEQGEVRVVKAGAKFELLTVNKMDDVCMATPAISGGALFVRSQHFLWALGRDRNSKTSP
jgi:outer membrane protein assembly factor BamB